MSKKIFALAMLVAGSVFVSCEDDNDFTDYKTVNYLEGKWELSQTGALNSLGVINYNDDAIAENCFHDSFVFDAETSFTATDYSTEGEACNQVETTGSYGFADGNLVLTSGETQVAYDILAFTNTTLELVYTDAETGELVFKKFKKV